MNQFPLQQVVIDNSIFDLLVNKTLENFTSISIENLRTLKSKSIDIDELLSNVAVEIS